MTDSPGEPLNLPPVGELSGSTPPASDALTWRRYIPTRRRVLISLLAGAPGILLLAVLVYYKGPAVVTLWILSSMGWYAAYRQSGLRQQAIALMIGALIVTLAGLALQIGIFVTLYYAAFTLVPLAGALHPRHWRR